MNISAHAVLYKLWFLNQTPTNYSTHLPPLHTDPFKRKKIINTHEIIDRKVILGENTSWSGSHEKLPLVSVYYEQSHTESYCEGQGTLTGKD